MRVWFFAAWFLVLPAYAASDVWRTAQADGLATQRAVKFCNRYAAGWLSHADSTTGLLPRRVNSIDDRYWNAKDCAADNYPFIVLTAELTGQHHLRLIARHLLEQEQSLTNRLDSLPDDFMFSKQGFRSDKIDTNAIIFGAAEYAKDGLIPVTEWIGPSPWSERMIGLIRDIWKHAPFESPAGRLPSDNVEVNGDLLQTMSRLYWLTGDEQFRTWVFQLSDYYFQHKDLLASSDLRLRDHGCEILGGLSEAYVIASRTDRDRHARWRPRMYGLLDVVLRHGVNEDGQIYNVIDPQSGKVIREGFSDGWGYVYNAFLTVAAVDGEQRYQGPVVHALANLYKYAGRDWKTSGGADECADFVEGGINLLNRIPVESAFKWVDSEIEYILGAQRHDGIIEAWYGDGNSARTVMMYALMKTKGLAPEPWREDMQVGAVLAEDGAVKVFLQAEFPWQGKLRFDRPRHREWFHLPMDYARINQFPEWFTAAADTEYEVVYEGVGTRQVSGRALWGLEFALEAGKPALLTVRPLASATPSPAGPASSTQAAAGSALEVTPTPRPPEAAASAAAISPPVAHPSAISPSPIPSLALDVTADRMRLMRYTPRSAEEAQTWQKVLRAELADLLKIDDLRETSIPLAPKLLGAEQKGAYSLREVEINSTPTRRIKVLVTVPIGDSGGQTSRSTSGDTGERTSRPPHDGVNSQSPAGGQDAHPPQDGGQDAGFASDRVRRPAVVCIHGHGSTRRTVYDDAGIYKGFADVLASSGYVTASIDVGQHEVYESGRTLMGERLWDLMRCVDLLSILPEVDPKRIGCAGLSLGGEMAMWLAACDERIAATVSAGFLTRMDQMEQNHCMCWKFDGLRELADFADIYSLIAPRPLQCQNGLAEPPTQFTVALARESLLDIKQIYTDLGKPGHAGLAVHPGGHEIDLPSLTAFFAAHLTAPGP